MREAHTMPTRCASCDAVIHRGLLMCLPCWFRVTPQTQRAVYRSLRQWKQGGSVREYLAARDQARKEAQA